MRYLYVCPSCQKAFSDESAAPLSAKVCPNCHNRLVYANCTKEEWDQKTQEEKQDLKLSYAGKAIELAQQAAASEASGYSQGNDISNTSRLERIDRNIASIKNMMIFFMVLVIIRILVSLYMLIKANYAIQNFQSFFY